MKKYVLFITLWLAACLSPNTTQTLEAEASNVLTPTIALSKLPTKTQILTLQPSQVPLTATIEALSADCNTARYTSSPNTLWITVTCDKAKINSSDEASTILKVVNSKTLQQWTVSYYQLYGQKELETVGSISDGRIFPAAWSADEIHLYIGVMPEVYREYYYNRTAALFALNLYTGERKEVLDRGIVQETFYDYSISYNGSKIAFINLLKKPLEIHSKDFDSSEILSAQLDSKFASAGSMIWAADDNSLIFLAVNFSGNSVLSTLYKWNIQTGELIEIVQLPDMLGRLFFIVKWNEKNNSVLLKNYYAEEFFNVDLSTGEITKAFQ